MQICININQIAVDKKVAKEFIDELKKEFKKQIGDALKSGEYPKLINEAAFNKLNYSSMPRSQLTLTSRESAIALSS